MGWEWRKKGDEALGTGPDMVLTPSYVPSTVLGDLESQVHRLIQKGHKVC